MGLNLKRQTTSDAESRESIRVGNYGVIHRFRKIVTLITVRHYLRAGQTSLADEAMHLFPGDYPEDWQTQLMAWTKKHSLAPEWLNDNDVDYSGVIDDVSDERLRGLLKFVDHSDCNGRHSCGDVVDIATLFERMSPDAEEVLMPEDLSAWMDIGSFFLAARDGHEYIRYC